jgi:DNA-binding MarR family transcriptional regulator
MAAWRALDAAHQSVQRSLQQALMDERELPLAWFRVLDELQLVGGRAVIGEVAAALHLPPSSLSRQLDRLEDEGWVRRMRGVGTDYRHVVVALTPEGRQVWRGAETTVRQTLRRGPLGAFERLDVELLTSRCEGLVEP